MARPLAKRGEGRYLEHKKGGKYANTHRPDVGHVPRKSW